MIVPSGRARPKVSTPVGQLDTQAEQRTH